MSDNGSMAATFTRMDESTAEQWAEIERESEANIARTADRILGLLRSLADITDGFATDQLTHCLQTATLAEEAGADKELIVASLCHDIGKAVSVRNHGAIGAEILKPYVRPDLVWMLQVQAGDLSMRVTPLDLRQILEPGVGGEHSASLFLEEIGEQANPGSDLQHGLPRER